MVVDFVFKFINDLFTSLMRLSHVLFVPRSSIWELLEDKLLTQTLLVSPNSKLV